MGQRDSSMAAISSDGRGTFPTFQEVQGRSAGGPGRTHVQVDHGGLQAGVSQQILDLPQLHTGFQQVGGVA